MRKDGKKTFHAADVAQWRAWLEEHHMLEPGVWLIIFHKKSDTPSVYYEEAVDEALCFGWVDSKPNKRDSESYYQYFSPRNPKSNWSRKNKEKIASLEREGRLAEAGRQMVLHAKHSGTWDALNEVEDLILPPDLIEAFAPYPAARDNFEAFPPSVKRGILEWIFNAKRPATRSKRIRDTVEKAEQNIRANQYRP